jgi:hypothetical protein
MPSMDRRAALATTSRSALVDAAGTPMPPTKPREIRVDSLPLVTGYNLPPGIAAYFCQENVGGQGPAIVLYSAQHEVSVAVPLSDMGEVERAAEMMANALPGRRRRAA